MCAIAGIVRFDRPALDCRSAVEVMLRHMRHRGPDDSNVIVFSHAVLGNARLSLVDRFGGTQPMSTPDGRWHLTYNGEIYNWRELRNSLQARWNFRTDSDTEVVLAALVLFGEDALPRFNGMFALFIWDEKTQTGFAARDRLGVKPYVFSYKSGVFAFSSEAKALVATQGSDAKADTNAVAEYLIAPFFSGVERPMFANLQHLLPGKVLRVSSAGIESKTWWDWNLPDYFETDEQCLATNVAQRLAVAIQQSMRCDHPVGAFLSGGLDSTLIAATAASNAGYQLPTFTINFEEQGKFDYSRSLIVRSDDTPYAEAAAMELGTRHVTVNVSRARLSEDLRRLCVINDCLPAWEQELAQHHLARAAAEAGVRCVLVGDAADETHYGYPFLLDAQATLSPENILRRFGVPPLNAGVEDAVSRLSEHYRSITDSAGQTWGTPLSRLSSTTSLIVKRWLPRLLHNGDIHTMAFSVEARVPFADISLVELCRTIHPHLALRGGCEKHVLREAARGMMPEANRIRKKSALPKDQFTSSIYQREAQDALNVSADFLGHWLDLAAIRELCHPERELTEAQRALLFRVICLHHWRVAYNVRNP